MTLIPLRSPLVHGAGIPRPVSMAFFIKSLLEAGSTTVVGPASSRPKTPLCYLAAYLTRRVLSDGAKRSVSSCQSWNCSSLPCLRGRRAARLGRVSTGVLLPFIFSVSTTKPGCIFRAGPPWERVGAWSVGAILLSRCLCACGFLCISRFTTFPTF